MLSLYRESLVSWCLITRSAIVGTKPSATTMDASSTTTIVKGIDLTNCPITPDRKNNGTNTATVVMVPAIKGQLNWLKAF